MWFKFYLEQPAPSLAKPSYQTYVRGARENLQLKTGCQLRPTTREKHVSIFSYLSYRYDYIFKTAINFKTLFLTQRSGWQYHPNIFDNTILIRAATANAAIKAITFNAGAGIRPQPVFFKIGRAHV